MKQHIRRLTAGMLGLLLVLQLIPAMGKAAISGTYFTAANEQVLPLSYESMPFWSGGVLYVSSDVFTGSAGTDLGVLYVKNNSMGLALLYTKKTDLRFDLRKKTAYDKQGTTYSGRAIEKNGKVFFPVDMVCRYFDLTWSYTETDIAPVIRLKSSAAILDDATFVDAASWQMDSYYDSYAKWWNENVGPTGTWPPIQAAEGQKIHLIIRHQSVEDTVALLSQFGTSQATFLLTAKQMENGDLLRGLVAGGHTVALLAQGETAEEIEEEIRIARQLLWQSSCSWMGLVWYEGNRDVTDLLQELGCDRVTVGIDRRDTDITTSSRIRSLLTAIGGYREDVTVFLGDDSGCVERLSDLLEGLGNAEYRICAWRSRP